MQTFLEAGAIIPTPSCAVCGGGNHLTASDVMISSTTVNLVGSARMVFRKGSPPRMPHAGQCLSIALASGCSNVVIGFWSSAAGRNALSSPRLVIFVSSRCEIFVLPPLWCKRIAYCKALPAPMLIGRPEPRQNRCRFSCRSGSCSPAGQHLPS